VLVTDRNRGVARAWSAGTTPRLRQIGPHTPRLRSPRRDRLIREPEYLSTRWSLVFPIKADLREYKIGNELVLGLGGLFPACALIAPQ
jgi:hypothetical protein